MTETKTLDAVPPSDGPTLPSGIWDIIGTYAIKAEEGLNAAVEANDVDALERVVRILRPNDCRKELKRACALGSAEVVRWLIRKYNVMPNDPVAPTGTLLHEACRNGHMELALELLVAPGMTRDRAINARPLVTACEGGHEQLAFRLITELKMTREEVMAGGNYALFMACGRGHEHLAFRLIAEMKMTKKEVRGALRYACHQRHRNIVFRLIKELQLTKQELGTLWTENAELAQELRNLIDSMPNASQ